MRTYRILHNPDATPPTGAPDATPPATPPAAATPPPAAEPPKAPAQDVMIQVSPQAYQELLSYKSQIAEIQAKAAQELAAKEQARLDALVAEGKANEALQSVQAKAQLEIAALQQQVSAQAVENAITRATMGTSWASESAGRQAQQLLAQECEVVTVDGRQEVRHRATGQPIAAVAAQRLDSSDYLHFRANTSKGGPGPANTGTPPPPPQGVTDPILAQALAARAQRNGNGAIGLVPQY